MEKGFTLVELLAVIAILALLVIIALPNVLKMFNDSKKNSFLTETKTIYSEVSKKYISESMKGNKLTYISSEDNTKLEMTGRDLQYCALLNTDGTIRSIKVSNGEWIAELPSGKKITDLNSADLKDGNLDNEECGPKKPKTFAKDDWDTIANAIRNNNTGNYNIGDEKDITLKGFGTFKVRIANKGSSGECNKSVFSKTACGFVVEFEDVIQNHSMNKIATSKGGWEKTDMRDYLNTTIYNSLSTELKNVIIDTQVVSGQNYEDSNIITTIDKIYLLSTSEVWASGDNEIKYDSAANYTRQLDYYNDVKTDKFENASKNASWWLRTANSSYYDVFYFVTKSGAWSSTTATSEYIGVSPAFRIG